MRSLLHFSLALGFLGCGPLNTFNGTVKGASLEVVDTIWVTQNGFSSLILADKPNLCATIVANRFPKNATYVSFSLSSSSPGDYTVGAGVNVFFAKTDDKCQGTFPTDDGLGKSGLLKITSLGQGSSPALSGTFDVSFGKQLDKATGSFSSRFCQLPSTPPTTAPSCE